MITKLNEWNSKLFKRIVGANQSHGVNVSRILSKELIKVSKTSKILDNARITFE